MTIVQITEMVKVLSGTKTHFPEVNTVIAKEVRTLVLTIFMAFPGRKL